MSWQDPQPGPGWGSCLGTAFFILVMAASAIVAMVTSNAYWCIGLAAGFLGILACNPDDW